MSVAPNPPMGNNPIPPAYGSVTDRRDLAYRQGYEFGWNNVLSYTIDQWIANSAEFYAAFQKGAADGDGDRDQAEKENP